MFRLINRPLMFARHDVKLRRRTFTLNHIKTQAGTPNMCVCIYTCFIYLPSSLIPSHRFNLLFRRKLLRGNVAHGGQHGNSAMLKLSLATSLEVLNTAISGKACWIPKSRWRLNAQLVLECGSHNLRSKCLQNTKLFFCPKKTFLDTSAFTSKSYTSYNRDVSKNSSSHITGILSRAQLRTETKKRKPEFSECFWP